MSEIVLELSLSRSSGVLAGIVATLAQNGLELKSQKLDRDRAARQGTAGWLTIHATGDAPDPEALARRLGSARGVDRIVHLEIDGRTIDGDSGPIAEPAGRPDEVGELSSGPVPATELVRETHAPATELEEDLPGDPDTPKAGTGAPETPADDAPAGPLPEPEPFLGPDPEPGAAPEPAPRPAPPPGTLPPLLVEDEDEDGRQDEPQDRGERGAESGTGDEETEGTNIPAPEHAETADEDLARALGEPGPDAAAADADTPGPLPEPPDRTEPAPDSAGRDAVADDGEQSDESADTRPADDNGNKPPKKSLRRRRRRWR